MTYTVRRYILDTMTALHATVAHAVTLAQRPEGVTAPELAEVAGCGRRAAYRALDALVRDGVLVVTVPERKGQARGDWRNVYRLAIKGGGVSGE